MTTMTISTRAERQNMRDAIRDHELTRDRFPHLRRAPQDRPR